jgi:hypothetical protein
MTAGLQSANYVFLFGLNYADTRMRKGVQKWLEKNIFPLSELNIPNQSL